MADEEKKPKPQSQPNKSIDVTKPRSNPAANLDASRVSDYTLKEQAALERLAKKIGGSGGIERKEDKSGNIKTIIAIVLRTIRSWRTASRASSE